MTSEDLKILAERDRSLGNAARDRFNALRVAGARSGSGSAEATKAIDAAAAVVRADMNELSRFGEAASIENTKKPHVIVPYGFVAIRAEALLGIAAMLAEVTAMHYLTKADALDEQARVQALEAR